MYFQLKTHCVLDTLCVDSCPWNVFIQKYYRYSLFLFPKKIMILYYDELFISLT